MARSATGYTILRHISGGGVQSVKANRTSETEEPRKESLRI